MSQVSLPTVSVVIPTRNSAKTLRSCLQSLMCGSYPKTKIELIIVDGYSNDETVDIAREFAAKIVNNPGIGFYTGKAIGVEFSTGELVLFIDSDNVLMSPDWLLSMVRPLVDDNNIVASEALYYGYAKSQHALVRYCALMGSDDPISVYLGFYGRYSHFKQKWSDIELDAQDVGSYIVVHLKGGTLPTMGANGFLIRSGILRRLTYKPYFFDVDLVHELVELGYDKVARVKVAVTHLYAQSLSQYARKAYRRIRDYYYFHKQGLRKYRWEAFNKVKFAKLILSCVLMIPMFRDSLRGYRRIRDTAWFLNWFLCTLTLVIYSMAEAFSGFYLLSHLRRVVRTKQSA